MPDYNKHNHYKDLVIHGEFIENPTCSICGSRISHEWLAGDYTMLVCEKRECFEEWDRKHLEKGKIKKLHDAAADLLNFLEGKK